MGNPKLRLSEMIPNTWFSKLNSSSIPKSAPKNHQSTTKNQPTPSPKPPLSSIRTTRGYPSPEFQGELPLHPDPISPQRKSYYFTRELLSNSKPGSFDFPEHFINPPLISPRRRRRRIKSTTIKHSPVSSPPSLAFTKIVSLSSSTRKTGDSVSSVSSVDLRPIRTERNKFGGAQEAIDEPFKQKKSSPKCRVRRANGSFSVNVVKEDSNSITSSVSGTRSVRRSPTGSPRFRIRAHSPRIATRVQGRGSLSNPVSKKGVSSKSLAVVKSSTDPQRDFRESMVEMIVENNITTPKDLEELLACYISLNSDQYHDVIIEVFAQIWFDLNNLLKEVKK